MLKLSFKRGDPVAHRVKHWSADQVVLSSIPGDGVALLKQPFIITSHGPVMTEMALEIPTNYIIHYPSDFKRSAPKTKESFYLIKLEHVLII